MIFRRNTNDLPAKTAEISKRQPVNNTVLQSDPRLSASRSSSSFTPSPSDTAMSNNNSTNQPMSPIAMAQSRRTQNGTAPAGFTNTRQEQLRKLTVGRDITLNGEITTCDHLIVEGNVSATIKGGQILEIMETGTFNGVVDIEQADIAGQFDGDLTVRGKLTLRPTARVSGTIQYRSLAIEAGAVLNGTLKTLPDTETTAGDTTSYTPNVHTLSAVNDQPGFLKS